MQHQKDRQYFFTGFVAFSTLYAAKNYVHHYRQRAADKREIRKLNSLQVKTIQQAIKSMEDQKQTKGQQWLIEGEVAGGKYSSSHQKNTKLILKVVDKKNIFTYDSFQEPSTKFNQKTSTDYIIERQPFFIMMQGNSIVEVALTDSTNIDTAVIKLGHKDIKRDISFVESFTNMATMYFGSLVRILGPVSVFNFLTTDSSYRGVHLGIRESEFGIKGEGLLQVLGSLTYNTQTKVLKIENPVLITLSKTRMINQIEQLVTDRTKACQFWGTVTFVGLLYIARRVYVYNQQNPHVLERIIQFFHKLRQPQPQQQASNLPQFPLTDQQLQELSQMQQQQQQAQVIEEQQQVEQNQQQQPEVEYKESAKTAGFS